MVSTLNGPIPPHPYYDKSGTNYTTPPAPRVRPEAMQYAEQAQGSVSNVLQIEGLRIESASSYRKYKPEPTNHVKENVRRMRQIQKDTRRKQEESAKPVKALWKSTKFECVGSKVKAELQRPASRPQSADYLRAHSRTGFNTGPQRPQSATSLRPEKLTVPKADSAREVKLKRNEVDFIKLNGRAASRPGSAMRRSPSLTALDDLKKKHEDEEKNYQRGAVPKYLVSRQKMWQREEEERRAAEPDPEMPPGHRAMDTAERKETLQKLKDTLTDLERQLSVLPIRSDTLRLRTKKEDLQRKIGEVEEAIKIFSRPKVFVKLDS